MENSKHTQYAIEELEARFEMESTVPTDDDVVDTDGWYCRCGYEE